MKQIDMHTIPVSCVSRSNQKMTNDVTGFKQILCYEFQNSKFNLKKN